jgi:acyl-ACP thioesterase
MGSVYKDEFCVSDLQCDRFGRLKPSAICWLVQEMAGRHCLQLGLDWESLAKKGMFWAILRHSIQVKRLPQKGDTIFVQTWPMPTTRVAFPRNVVAFDKEGNELFRTTSVWVLMDMEKRAMVLPGKSGVEVPGVLLGGEVPAPGSLTPKTPENRQTRPVRFTDLDLNGHMNNCRYLDWAADLLPSDFHRDHSLSCATLGYLAEAREGDAMELCFGQQDDGSMDLEILRQGQRIFAASLLFT